MSSQGSASIDAFITFWSNKRISPEEKKLLWANIPVLKQIRQILVNEFGGKYTLSNLDAAFARVRDQLYPAETPTATSKTEAAERRLEAERKQRKESQLQNVNAHQFNSTVSSLVENAKSVKKRVDESAQIAAKQAAEEIVNEATLHRNGRPLHAATTELRKQLAGVFAHLDATKKTVDWAETLTLRRRLLREVEKQNDSASRGW